MTRIVHKEAIPMITVITEVIITSINTPPQTPRGRTADSIVAGEPFLASEALHTPSMATPPQARFTNEVPLLEGPAILILINWKLAFTHPHKLALGCVIVESPYNRILFGLNTSRIKIPVIIERSGNVALLANNADPCFVVQEASLLLNSKRRAPRSSQTIMPTTLALQFSALFDLLPYQTQRNFLVFFPLIFFKGARVASLGTPY